MNIAYSGVDSIRRYKYLQEIKVRQKTTTHSGLKKLSQFVDTGDLHGSSLFWFMKIYWEI